VIKFIVAVEGLSGTLKKRRRMKYHDDELCKAKLECIVGFLDEIQDAIEHPKTDREEWIRSKLELALQDLMYLSNEVNLGEDETHS
jgi:hypothetical protein